MALCPFARQRLIPESWTQGRITPRVLIFHEAVSSADSLYNYWNSPGVELESHFYVYRDGSLDQYVDTNTRADANWDANPFAISVETWDNGGEVDGSWTDAQLATLTRLAAWCEDAHDIPAEVPITWDGRGMGWHNLYAARWAGGARACPGPNRALQVRNRIIPAVRAGYDWRAGGNDVGTIDGLSEAGKRALFYETPIWTINGEPVTFGVAIERILRAVTDVFPSASGGYKMSPRDAWRYVDFVQIKIDGLIRVVDGMATVLASVAENDDRIEFDPAQFQQLRDDLNRQADEIKAELVQQVDEQLDELADRLAERTDTDRDVVLGALNEFYGRAVEPPAVTA